MHSKCKGLVVFYEALLGTEPSETTRLLVATLVLRFQAVPRPGKLERSQKLFRL